MTSEALIAQAGQLLAQGRMREALGLIQDGRARAGHDARLAFAHGVLALEAGDPRQAICVLRESLALDPSRPEALIPFARALAPANKIVLLQRWAKLSPLDATPLIDLSHAYRDSGAPDQALVAAQAALTLDRQSVRAWSAYGAACHAQGQLDHAIQAFCTALALSPHDRSAWINLSLVHSENSHPAQALWSITRAHYLAPGLGDAEWGMGLNLWMMGHLPQAWTWFEGRLARPGMVRADIAAKPQWHGEDFAGRTLLLWAEQGQGDSLQFIRYYDQIKARGGRVIIEVQPSLKRLFQGQQHYDAVFARGEALEPFDLQLAMMSAPYVFQTDATHIPAPIPYLRAPGQFKLAGTAGLKVGLVWAGNPGNVTADRVRSAALSIYLPLLSIPGIHFYALQVGTRGGVGTLPPHDNLTDLAPALEDFSVTADALTQIDLLISTCTSVPHLAGAMGRPVWLVLNKSSDYRWGLNGATTAWYPSFRLYRQRVLRDWQQPIADIARDLEQWVKQIAGT
jgi:tetratricopeptide (TPR) repeat protein